MSYDKKDLETISKVFAALSKAKWDSLDGNAIIEIHGAFLSLRKLEEKITQGLQAPAPKPIIEEVKEEPAKKTSRKK